MVECSDHPSLLRQAIELARQASARGNAPFGALIVASDHTVLARATNTAAEHGLSTRHAEINAIEQAQRAIGSRDLSGCTLIASAEPCPMCSGAIFWSGLSAVVFGASIGRMMALDHNASGQLPVGCGELLADSPRPIAVTGPLLEDEALQVFAG